MALITVYKKWIDEQSTSDTKNNMDATRIWCDIIPKYMAKEYGTVRYSVSRVVASNPYNSQLAVIKAQVSNVKYISVDGPEETRPEDEAPSGGGTDEYGNFDERMQAYESRKEEKNLKKCEQIKKRLGKDYVNLMKVVEHFNSLFPQSIAGVGILSEGDLMSGSGRKRGTPESDCSILSSQSIDSRVTKKLVMAKIGETINEQHKESMNYMREHHDKIYNYHVAQNVINESARMKTAEKEDTFRNNFLNLMGNLVAQLAPPATQGDSSAATAKRSVD